MSDALLELRRLERTSESGNRGTCEVTPAQGMLVHEVVRDGSAGSTASRLATRLGISVSAVTQLVDGLVEARILQRQSDSEDRRRTRIVLTDHGRTLYGGFERARIAQAEALLRDLNDDQVRQLAVILGEVTREAEPS